MEDNLIKAVATYYERDAIRNMNEEKELEDIVEEFLATIRRTCKKGEHQEKFIQ